MTTYLQTSPYLQKQRNFPTDNVQALGEELDISYIDIANKVNNKTIGLFALNGAVINGESWYLQGQPQRQQGLRQVYLFSGSGNVPHGINMADVSFFSPKTYGSFTDGTNWYGAIFGSNTSISGEVSFYITPTNIVILSGAGAPTITSGYIVLEWVSNVVTNS